MNIDYADMSRRWFEEVWNQRRVDIIDEFLCNESFAETEGGTLRGAEQFKTQMYGPFLQAFPNLSVTIDGLVAQGDEVVVRWRATGTHNGDGLGIPATGKELSIRGMTWHRYADGKLLEAWDCWNQEALFSQLRAG